MSSPTNTGLSEKSLATLRAIFARHPEVESVTLYGSRAKGTHRPGSDIDLTLHGDPAHLTHATRSHIAGELDDSPLPYTVDLSLFDELTNPDLRDHIARVGIELYRRPSPSAP